MISLRDAFFNRLYEHAETDHDVILVSADMGAPSLDKWRKNLPSQYVNVGIAEQNMIAVATGLALSGKKVWCYAIMPFTTLRCYEFLKLDVALMNIPITIVGIGSGYSYDDSGPTHHTVEDISIMRALPNFEIYNPSDYRLAEELATWSYAWDKNPIYIRLDRMINERILPQIYSLNAGAIVYNYDGKSKTCIITTGNLVHKAIKTKHIVIDLFRLKPVDGKKLADDLKRNRIKKVITWEEHFLNGGLGSIIAEIFADNNVEIPLQRIGVNDQYTYEYGGRENIQKKLGINSCLKTK